MSVFDFITFIEYNNWANSRLLDTAEQIPPADLAAGSLSQGTAFETLRHVLDVEWSWRLTCEGQEAADVLWKIEPLEDLPAIRTYWHTEGERLLAFVRTLPEEDFDREVVASWSKKSFQIKHILMHIVNHATNHRSEIGWYFTKLGHSPGDLEFAQYIDMQR
jgi:uncharacterized damage-inducible protein DinB